MARYDLVTQDASGEVQKLIPDLVRAEVTASSIEMEVFRPLSRVLDVSGPGANSDVPNFDMTNLLAFAAHTPGSEVAEDTLQMGSRTITTVQRTLDVIVPIKVLQDSAVSIPDEIQKEVARRLADDRDTRAAAIYTEAPSASPAHEIGTDGVELSTADLRDGQELLYIQKAPKPFNWVVYPTQWTELLKDDLFVSAAIKGSSVLTNGIGPNGFGTQYLDVRVFVAEQIVESSGRHSMMFSPGAIGYAYKNLSSPLSPTPMEILFETDYTSAYRADEYSTTYEGIYVGLKGTSNTTNTWMVDIKS